MFLTILLCIIVVCCVAQVSLSAYVLYAFRTPKIIKPTVTRSKDGITHMRPDPAALLRAVENMKPGVIERYLPDHVEEETDYGRTSGRSAIINKKEDPTKIKGGVRHLPASED